STGRGGTVPPPVAGLGGAGADGGGAGGGGGTGARGAPDDDREPVLGRGGMAVSRRGSCSGSGAACAGTRARPDGSRGGAVSGAWCAPACEGAGRFNGLRDTGAASVDI